MREDDHELGRMIRIPAGAFVMGDDADPVASPAHIAVVASFAIDRFPVTAGEYAQFVEATGHPPPPGWPRGRPDSGRLDHPVVDVCWHDAVAYAVWAGKRLPTEAEWEKAASWNPATESRRRWPWGDDWREGRANAGQGILGVFRHHETTPVHRFAGVGDSAFGVSDMAGNVWEWTSSRFLPYPYVETDARESPTAAGSRVLRGGSWDSTPEQCACAARLALAPGRVIDRVCGFRCAVSVRRDDAT